MIINNIFGGFTVVANNMARTMEKKNEKHLNLIPANKAAKATNERKV